MVPHEIFKRVNDDLELVVKIPMTAAALGTEVQVATLEADLPDPDPEDTAVTVTVPSGTQSGTRVTIEGKGAPRLRGNGRGDLGVTLLVQTPTKLDDGQRELLRQLAEARDESRPEGTRATAQQGRVRPDPRRLRRAVTITSIDCVRFVP